MIEQPSSDSTTEKAVRSVKWLAMTEVVSRAISPIVTVILARLLAPEDFESAEEAEPKKIPLIFPWKKLGNDRLLLTTDMHLLYPNPLQPDKWPRESS